MIAYSFFMRESNAWLLILKLPFLYFSGEATASNLSFSAPAIVCHLVGITVSLVTFLHWFLSWWKDSPCSSAMLLRFQKNSLHDYEENEPSHSYCTLIVSKNLTGVSKGCDSWELWLNFPVVKAFFFQGCHGEWKIFVLH